MTDRSEDEIRTAFERYWNDNLPDRVFSMDVFDVWQAAVKWATEKQIEKDASIAREFSKEACRAIHNQER